ncbi:MAG: hypothetical protein OXI60_07425 [Acidiferrobacterales bacterium]|nr:hypothetical protein [Acidiferrobacterales bacterium]
MNKTEWTLSEIAKLLQQPQHRLIYLCEKRVITPDFSDAKGRGSSRRFSTRNVFEFSITLVLSDFHFPTALSTNILYVLREFEESVSKTIDNFNLPDALMVDGSPEIVGIITNGTLLYFAIGAPGRPKKIYGGVDISENNENCTFSLQEVESSQMTQNAQFLTSSSTSNLARFEFKLTNIARSLMLEIQSL